MPNFAGANRKLFNAAKKGDGDGVRAALAAGAEVAARDGNGWTPLHEACRWGGLEAVRSLLAAGADPNAPHPDLSYAPLFVATFEKGHVAIVRSLLDAGAAPSLSTKHGFTALHNAAAQGDMEVVEALLEAGADPGALGGTAKEAPADCAAPDVAAGVRALIARYTPTPKQTSDEATRAAVSTRTAEKLESFVEAKPLVLAKIEVTAGRTKVHEDDLAKLRKASGGALPTGYGELLATTGPGTLAGKVRVFGPLGLLRERPTWQARLEEHWFWGEGPLLTQADARQATRIADTLDGDELVFHPRAPDTLLVLPRETEQVVVASHEGLLPALARLLGRVPRKLVLEPMKDEP